jgi:hypothetical protein
MAPEMAAGLHLVELRRKAVESRENLLCIAIEFGGRSSGRVGRRPSEFEAADVILSNLTMDDAGFALKDFDVGVDHLEVVINVKTVYCKNLPFAINVLALVDEADAVSRIDGLLHMFDSAPDKEGFDRVSRLWLDPSFPMTLRFDLIMWRDNYPNVKLNAYPRLRTLVSSRRFIPNDESFIEVGHGKMKKKRQCDHATAKHRVYRSDKGRYSNESIVQRTLVMISRMYWWNVLISPVRPFRALRHWALWPTQQ